MPAADGGRAGWQLVWRDEFDGPEGAPPSPARWTPEVGGNGWGNAQLEHNTDRIENAALDGAGHLRITARREQYRGNAYTSARLVTREGIPGDEIAAVAGSGKFDLVVMGSHGHGAIGALLMGSTAQRVLAHCSTPVLLIRR